MTLFNPYAPDWHKAADIPPDITLEEYASAWRDMEPHVVDLMHYAFEAKIIVEFGLRGGVSTWALLSTMSASGFLVGVDIDPSPPLPKAVTEDPRFTFINNDSLKAPLPDVADLVMIDSSHEFTQTVLELHRAAKLKPKRILLHDYLYRHTPHVRWAVDGWTADPYTPDHWDQVPYRIETVHASEWGLVVLVPR